MEVNTDINSNKVKANDYIWVTKPSES